MFTALGLCFVLMQAPGGDVAVARSKEAVPLEVKLQARVANYSLVADNFLDALLRVASEYKIPMGIEWVRTPPAMRSVKLTWEVATVEEIIRGVVRSCPGHEMKAEDGVLRIFAPRLIPARQNFLKLRVHEFEVNDEVVEIAERRLVDIVNSTVSPPKPQAKGKMGGGMGHSQGVEVGDPHFTLKLRDVTVEDVLDALVLASDRGVWTVTFAPTGKLTPSGFRQTASPAGTEPRAKPYWELLRWGRNPY